MKIVGVFPAGSHPAIIYPVAQSSASKNAGVARYLAFLRTQRGQGDLREIRLQFLDQADVVASVLDAYRPRNGPPIALSLRIAVVATLVALPFGIAIATLLARKDFWGKSLLDAVVHLPLVLPPVVTGYLLLITLGRKAPVGAFLDRAFRHRVRVPLDRRGARLRRDGVSADGARRSGCRSRRSTAGWKTPPRRSAPTGRGCSSP